MVCASVRWLKPDLETEAAIQRNGFLKPEPDSSESARPAITRQ